MLPVPEGKVSVRWVAYTPDMGKVGCAVGEFLRSVSPKILGHFWRCVLKLVGCAIGESLFLIPKVDIDGIF